MSFLTAEWRKLAIFNYKINPKVLKPYIPFGTELDLWNNNCYVSIIGFMFLNTKLKGLPIPFHKNFEEVNLRFYVKRFENNEWKRGVVFIKEIVPKPALSFIANVFYNEHYETLPMKHHWESLENDQQKTEYSWQVKDKWNTISVISSIKSIELESGSEAEFITEHYWGYSQQTESSSNEYEVTHPKWEVYPIESYKMDVDFGLSYGQDFEFLNQEKPHSVMLAEGSEITVEPKSKI